MRSAPKETPTPDRPLHAEDAREVGIAPAAADAAHLHAVGGYFEDTTGVIA
jgi:hypothetical protein